MVVTNSPSPIQMAEACSACWSRKISIYEEELDRCSTVSYFVQEALVAPLPHPPSPTVQFRLSRGGLTGSRYRTSLLPHGMPSHCTIERTIRLCHFHRDNSRQQG